MALNIEGGLTFRLWRNDSLGGLGQNRGSSSSLRADVSSLGSVRGGKRFLYALLYRVNRVAIPLCNCPRALVGGCRYEELRVLGCARLSSVHPEKVVPDSLAGLVVPVEDGGSGRALPNALL